MQAVAPPWCVLQVHFIQPSFLHTKSGGSIPLSTVIPSKDLNQQAALTWVSGSPTKTNLSGSFSAPVSNPNKTHWFTTMDVGGIYLGLLLVPYLG